MGVHLSCSLVPRLHSFIQQIFFDSNNVPGTVLDIMGTDLGPK